MAKENDIVLIHFEDKPLIFARIEEILPDPKADWYQIKLLMLQVPLQVATWILKDTYIDGAEFTMDGKKLRMEQVFCPKDQKEQQLRQEKQQTTPESAGGKVISLDDLRKK